MGVFKIWGEAGAGGVKGHESKPRGAEWRVVEC